MSSKVFTDYHELYLVSDTIMSCHTQSTANQVIQYLVYRPVYKMVLGGFLTTFLLVGTWTWKITEVLSWQHARNYVIAKYGRHRPWRKSLLLGFLVYVQVLYMYHFYYCFS